MMSSEGTQSLGSLDIHSTQGWESYAVQWGRHSVLQINKLESSVNKFVVGLALFVCSIAIVPLSLIADAIRGTAHLIRQFVHQREVTRVLAASADKKVLSASSSLVAESPIPETVSEEKTDLKSAPSTASASTKELDDKLLKAAEDGDVKAVKALIAAGANVNARKHLWEATPLIKAASRYTISEDDALDAVKALIAAGADVNAADGFGNTALIKAAQHNDVNIVRTLLAAGADVNARHISGKTALNWAEEYDFPLMINALEDPQADLNDQFVHAAQYGNVSTVKALIAAGANVNATYRYKNACYGYGEYALASSTDTALMLAAKHSKVDTVRALISAGVNVNAANEYGETALIIAIKHALGNPWRSIEEVATLLAKALINAGANVNVADKYGNTPLKLAKERGYTEIVDAINERLK